MTKKHKMKNVDVKSNIREGGNRFVKIVYDEGYQAGAKFYVKYILIFMGITIIETLYIIWHL